MKDEFINGCKRLKVIWDTITIVKKIIILLSLFGVGSVGYLATDTDETTVAITAPQPEYALKGHVHMQPVQIIIDHAPAIKQAIKEYDEKHDPQKLGH